MKILIVGEPGGPHGLGEALEAEGVEVERPPEGACAPRDEGIGELAAALIAFERLLGDDAPDAVLLVSASNPALAAILVATKLQIPVAASVEAAPGEDGVSETNGRLIARLADGILVGDAATIAASVRDMLAA